MLDLGRIQAITLDLDDTLWPIWPTIERAEQVLHGWLSHHAPRTAALFANAQALRDIRVQVGVERPDLEHDLSALRFESLRRAIASAGEDTALTQPAFDIFFEARQDVTLFDDALPCLKALAGRYPVATLSNGNADVQKIGLGAYFRATITANDLGIAKPDVRIFQAAADALGVAPHHVLHVGDDATLDAWGAMQAGMQAAWLNRGDHPWPHDGMPEANVVGLSALCDMLGLAQ